MEIYLALVLFFCAGIFGFIAKKLTEDEQIIYKKKKYFPAIKIVFALTGLIFLFKDRTISILLMAMLIMVIVWDYKRDLRRSKK
jgi:4-amino-4-deoxy-L-arabinose transferase-like glycosyltransferase